MLGHFALSVPGEHNVSNAVAALASGDLLGIPASVMADGLLSFHGTDRRFQKKGVIGGVTIIDDYAHHPTEIKATLQRGKEFSMQACYGVSSSHTPTRGPRRCLMISPRRFHWQIKLCSLTFMRHVRPIRSASAQMISAKRLDCNGKRCLVFPHL